MAATTRRGVDGAAVHPAARAAAPRENSAEEDEGWPRLKARTLVDLVAEALMEAAARGKILPGDRIVEADVTRRLGVSRVPVREALRILESQGVVVNEPYRGITLTPFSPERLDDLIETRISLESTAAARAIREGRNGTRHLAPLQATMGELEDAARRGDAYALAVADTRFHRAFCALGGNRVLSELWEGLARQVTIFFGLSTLGKPMRAIVDEHEKLLAELRKGDVESMRRAIDDHISVQNHAVDFAALIARRRLERDDPSAPTKPRRGTKKDHGKDKA